MKIVTAGIRTELGGVPYNEETAIEPMRDLDAYYLRFLLALRPPQSINIFADFDSDTNTVKDRMATTFGDLGMQVEISGDAASLGTSSTDSDGVLAGITSLRGDTGSNLKWPINSIPGTFTICAVSRYASSGAKHEILSCEDSPDQSHTWFHGFWNNRRGVAFYLGWRTEQDKTIGTQTDWLIMCGTSGGTIPGNIIIDQLEVGESVGGIGNNGLPNGHPCQLGVNYAEQSDYEPVSYTHLTLPTN